MFRRVTKTVGKGLSRILADIEEANQSDEGSVHSTYDNGASKLRNRKSTRKSTGKSSGNQSTKTGLAGALGATLSTGFIQNQTMVEEDTPTKVDEDIQIKSDETRPPSEESVQTVIHNFEVNLDKENTRAGDASDDIETDIIVLPDTADILEDLQSPTISESLQEKGANLEGLYVIVLRCVRFLKHEHIKINDNYLGPKGMMVGFT